MSVVSLSRASQLCAKACRLANRTCGGGAFSDFRPRRAFAQPAYAIRGQFDMSASSSVPAATSAPATSADPAGVPAGAPPATTLPADSIGFIGCGSMSGAILRGLIKSGQRRPEDAAACVRSKASTEALEALGLRAVHGDAVKAGGAAEVARTSRVLVLGVKPQGLAPVLEALAPHVTPDHVVISVVAGATLTSLEGALPEHARVTRVMPNTPSLVGEGAAAYALGSRCSDEDGELVEALFGAVGLVARVDESAMDAVTGVSGSGPAYVFTLIDAMADGGVAAGLPRAVAQRLAAQTVLGAAAMVLRADPEGGLTHPGILKDRVASPGGTTIAGIAELEAGNLRGTIIKAVRAAANRSKELS